MVVGSRYLAEGGFGDWSQGRRTISRVATGLSRLVLRGCHLTDPMSGFFMLKREMFDAAVRRLSQEGYKILLDILASSPMPARIKEVPYVFGLRRHGQSKLDSLVVLDYVTLLLDKLVGRWVPVRFLMFMARRLDRRRSCTWRVLAAALKSGVAFLPAQTIATTIAIAGNFFLNNALTYRDKRLKGLGRGAAGAGELLRRVLHRRRGQRRHRQLPVRRAALSPGGSPASPASWWARCGITRPPRCSRGGSRGWGWLCSSTGSSCADARAPGTGPIHVPRWEAVEQVARSSLDCGTPVVGSGAHPFRQRTTIDRLAKIAMVV